MSIDYDHETVYKAQQLGKNVIWGDVTDSNFWQNVDLSQIKMIFLAFSSHASNVNTSIELSHLDLPNIKIGSVCEFRDQAKELLSHQVDYVYNYREQVGKEFANEFIKQHIQ
jgi:ribosomal protein L35AE/L33A